MKIRKATKEDTKTLLDIWIKSKYNLKNRERMLWAIKQSLRYSENYIIENPKPIGNFVITNKKDITYLNYITFIKTMQEKGYGKIIMEKIIIKAKKNKSKKIQLAVWAKNMRAILLYTKFGFYIIGLKRRFDKKLGKKLVMERSL